MIRRGEVSKVRELGRGVQASVCLGASTKLGTAVVTVELKSPAVLEALDKLKDAIRAETVEMTAAIMEDHAKWAESMKAPS